MKTLKKEKNEGTAKTLEKESGRFQSVGEKSAPD